MKIKRIPIKLDALMHWNGDILNRSQNLIPDIVKVSKSLGCEPDGLIHPMTRHLIGREEGDNHL